MQALKLYNKIKQIEYHMPENKNDKSMRCFDKHRLLYKELKENNYEVRYRACNFKWSSQPLPKEILCLAPKDIDYHLFLEIKLNNKWISVDCTYEDGYPMASYWDGKTDSKLSIIPLKILNEKESKEVEENDKINFSKEIKDYKELFIEINKLLKNIKISFASSYAKTQRNHSSQH